MWSLVSLLAACGDSTGSPTAPSAAVGTATVLGTVDNHTFSSQTSGGSNLSIAVNGLGNVNSLHDSSVLGGSLVVSVVGTSISAVVCH